MHADCRKSRKRRIVQIRKLKQLQIPEISSPTHCFQRHYTHTISIALIIYSVVAWFFTFYYVL